MVITEGGVGEAVDVLLVLAVMIAFVPLLCPIVAHRS